MIVGCLDQVGEQSVNIARSAVLARRIPESVPGDDDRPPVRQLPAGRPLRRPGRHGGRLRHRHRGRRRVDDARADVGQRARPREPPTGPRFRERYGLAADCVHRPGDLRRDDRRALRADPRGARRLRPRVAPARGGGHRRGPLRGGDPARPRRARGPRLDGDGGRGDPSRDDPRDARRAAEGVPRGRPPDGRHLSQLSDGAAAS